MVPLRLVVSFILNCSVDLIRAISAVMSYYVQSVCFQRIITLFRISFFIFPKVGFTNELLVLKYSVVTAECL